MPNDPDPYSEMKTAFWTWFVRVSSGLTLVLLGFAAKFVWDSRTEHASATHRLVMLERDLAAIQAWQTRWKNYPDDAEKLLAEGQLRSSSAMIREVSDKLSTLSREVGSLLSQVVTQNKAMEDRVTQLVQQISTINDRLTRLESRITSKSQ